ncbi:MAG: NAD(P)H-hydrate dehydratase [Eubacteriales bacterium]|nr:NAD(P)H-hydrate dehydratase [Eubacteriales bacterium]NCC80738.1 NAD(P)H-hydrate dehydratase [Clostridia bacterium]
MIQIVDGKLVKNIIPKRFQDSHKGSYGTVAVICGSKDMPGASRLVSRGAYAAGAGLVKSFAGESFASYLKTDIPEVIVKEVYESLFNTFSEDLYMETENEIGVKDIIVFGCGVGQNVDLESAAEDLVINNCNTLIIDGDGINLLKNNPEILLENKGIIILTPHPKEFSRITGHSVEYILRNKEDCVRDFAMKYNVYLLLKGKGTIISDPEGNLWLNNSGNSSLSKGGTGDVLSGFIAGFAAQGASPLESMIVASYLHGKAGEMASEELSEYCVMASDLIKFLPNAIKVLQGDE